MRLRALIDAALSVGLAPVCAGCAAPLERPLEGPVCAACWASIHPPSPPLCRLCGDSLASWRISTVFADTCVRCRRAPRAVDAGGAAGQYAGALREIVHAFKYQGRRSLAIPLGRLLRTRSGSLLQDAHCAVPVPLHPWRRLVRGFNQSADLARETGLPVVHALWRTRATVPQSGLPPAARHRNVRDAFALSPFMTARQRTAMLSGRIVVVVDDVRTTGATLDACARLLKAAGAREVRALTLAAAQGGNEGDGGNGITRRNGGTEGNGVIDYSLPEARHPLRAMMSSPSWSCGKG
jgi:ComF family protein